MPDCFYVNLLEGVLVDALKLCPGYSTGELTLDLQTIRQRLMAEGESFVTKTLVQLRKHVLHAIEQGAFTPLASFKKKRRGGSLPCFLYGLYNAVFDDSGVLRPSPCGQSLRAILQLTSLFSKLEGACSEERKYEQVKSFIALDKECAIQGDVTPLIQSVAKYAAGVVYHLFKYFAYDDIRPKPGSGAEAEHTPYYQRWSPSVVPCQVEGFYSYSAYHFLNDRHLFDEFELYMDADLRTDIAARMEAVAKNTESWRLICVVGNGYMFIQQGLKNELYDHIERHPLTKGHINFYDQRVNGRMAYTSSITLEYATLDMKDASDRIMKWHIRLFFERVPELRDRLLALSENYIEVPTIDGKRERMVCEKFAPMGSALCFPVMSVVHYALLAAAVYHVAAPHDAKRHSRDVFVYGDDLLVRSCYAEDVINIMEQFGLKFNRSKCYITSHFRESCGVDAYNGVLVTPTRIKKRLNLDPCAETITAYLAYESDLFSNGFISTARALRHHIRVAYFERRYRQFKVPLAAHPETGIIAWGRKSSSFCGRFNAYVDRRHGRFKKPSPTATSRELPWYDDDVTRVEVAQSETIAACFTSGWSSLFQALLAKEQGADTVLVSKSPGKIARKSVVRASIHGRSSETTLQRLSIEPHKMRNVHLDRVRQSADTDPVSNRPRDLARRRVYHRFSRVFRT